MRDPRSRKLSRVAKRGCRVTILCRKRCTPSGHEFVQECRSCSRRGRRTARAGLARHRFTDLPRNGFSNQFVLFAFRTTSLLTHKITRQANRPSDTLSLLSSLQLQIVLDAIIAVGNTRVVAEECSHIFRNTHAAKCSATDCEIPRSDLQANNRPWVGASIPTGFAHSASSFAA